jgi:hypothetical protein
MVVSKETFLKALIESKEREIPIRTMDRTGAFSAQQFRISEVKTFRNAYGEVSLSLILLPLSDSLASVIEFKHLFGVKFEKSVNVQGCVTNELGICL